MTRLEVFRRLKDLTHAQLAKELGRTQPQVSRYLRAKEDVRRSHPGPDVAGRLHTLTHGVIHLGNYADEVTPAEAAEMMAEIARREADAKAREVSRG